MTLNQEAEMSEQIVAQKYKMSDAERAELFERIGATEAIRAIDALVQPLVKRVNPERLTTEERDIVRAEFKALRVSPTVELAAKAIAESSITKWGAFIMRCAMRLANSEDLSDRIEGGWHAALKHAKLPPTKLAFRIRNGVAIGMQRHETSVDAAPFSHLVHTDDEGEEIDPSENLMDENMADMFGELEDDLFTDAHERILGVGDPEVKDANYIELAEDAMAEALRDGDTEKYVLIAHALAEFEATVRVPDVRDDERPLFKFEQPKGDGGKGDWELLAEDAEEELSDASDDLCDSEMRASPIPMHANELPPERRPDVETFPRGCWRALRETWGKPQFDKTLLGVWSKIDPETESENVWLLRFFGQHLVNQGKIEERQAFYEVAIPLLGLPAVWLDCEEQEEELGEEAVDSAAGELGHIARVLWAIDWEGRSDEELPDMEWPEEELTFESTGTSMIESGAYIERFVNAAMNGATWTEAVEAGKDGYFGAQLSKEGQQLRVKGADRNTVKAVNAFTASTDYVVVGLKEGGLKVNGKGTEEFWPWEKAIPVARVMTVTERKEQALIEACRKLEGKAAIFAQALESSYKWRQEQTHQMEPVEA
jgi:hypothetical protein